MNIGKPPTPVTRNRKKKKPMVRLDQAGLSRLLSERFESLVRRIRFSHVLIDIVNPRALSQKLQGNSTKNYRIKFFFFF